MMGGGTSRLGEFGDKLVRLRSLLRARGDAAAALRSRRNFAWLTAGGDNHVVRATEDGVATLLVTEHDVVVVTAVNEAARIADEELAGLGIELVAVPWERPEALAEEIAVRAGRVVADDAALESELRLLRASLMPPEQERLTRLGAATARAMTEAFASVSPGEPETVAAERLAALLAVDGIASPVLLAASDERIARIRHPIPTTKRIDGALMLIVVAERGGLHVATSRMGWLRGGPDRETVRRYAAVVRVDEALRDASRPGRTLAEVLGAGIAAYATVGFSEEWRLHHQGGLIGYQPREVIATPTTETEIAAGMAFAWNPSITGVKAEDTIIVGADGSQQIVTRDPGWPSIDDGAPDLWTASG